MLHHLSLFLISVLMIILFYFFTSIILIKFTRFKEYGLDIFAFCIIGMLSHYLISFYKTKNKIYFNKSLLLIVFGFFIKQYIIITIFYLIYYLYKLKLKIFLFSTKNGRCSLLKTSNPSNAMAAGSAST